MGNSKSVTFSDQVEKQSQAEAHVTNDAEPLGGEALFMGDSSQQQIEDVLSHEDKAAEEGAEEGEFEMTEEETEQEVDEIQEDGLVLKRKKSVMKKVRRKKYDILDKLEKSKGIQMPEWTEALEIEYMNKD